MKATGIVRRIDDLGRVVIPKEIRRTMRIREGDPLEIFTGKEGEVVFKKYSPMESLADHAAEYAASVHTVSGFACAVCDRDRVVAFAGAGKREALEREISARCEELLSARRAITGESEASGFPLLRDQDQIRVQAAYPIIASGDIIGMICLIQQPEKRASLSEERLIQVGAQFLGKQLEN